MIVGHHDIGGAEDVDAVAPLAGTAVERTDAGDAVASYQRAVLARIPAVDQNAAIDAVAYLV